MIILSFDTAMAACSAAVADATSGTVLASACEAMERGHAEALAPMLDQVMREAGVAFSAIDRIAVTTGPGTFTGVRIGLSMARGLGLALGIPVIGIDTLKAIAANDTSGLPVQVVAHARNREVFTAGFEPSGGQVLKPCVMKRVEVLDQLPTAAVLIGTAASSVLAESRRGDLQLSTASNLPAAAVFWRLAVSAASPDSGPAPLYLRLPDAKPQSTPLRRATALIFTPVAASDSSLLAEIYAEAFEKAWTAGEFNSLLAMPGAKAIIALEQDEPCGFILTRQAVDESEIIAICTRPVAQRRGVARALLDHLFTDFLAEGITQIFIEVAVTNTAARGLYHTSGFKQTGLRTNYYKRADGSMDDAIVMRRDLKP